MIKILIQSFSVLETLIWIVEKDLCMHWNCWLPVWTHTSLTLEFQGLVHSVWLPLNYEGKRIVRCSVIRVRPKSTE